MTKIVFAAGNKFEATEVRSSVRSDGRTLWYVVGKRWIKSKGKFSTNALIHYVGEGKPVEIKEEEAA
ncbi:MAG: hypothetical protein JWR80_10030 [Bradyrhizobium sp.]|nr:hypothetical protein [Bradyrhizobium sp.]